MRIPEKTRSVCPVCWKTLPAERVERNGEIFLEKTCPEHGTFSAVIWRNRLDYDAWRGDIAPLGEEEGKNCGSCAGLCREHRRHTCCTLLEVTSRCNMNCAFCFAEAGGVGEDPDIYRIKAQIFDLTVPGETFLQLSGGEPTVRDDLPEIVAFARKCGCRYVQLNSNGIRLAEDEEYVKALAKAGLSFVFLQFDGTVDRIYEKLRRRPMMEIKKRCIENCGKYRIGVTLVPVIVPGVNADQIGEILRFAIRRSPVVRGVHFQPVSYFGRVPALPRDEDRFTPDELAAELVTQSGGLISPEDLSPSCCDHPLCGLHGDFAVMPDGTLYSLTRRNSRACGRALPEKDPALKNREFIGRRWSREKSGESRETAEEMPDMSDMDTFLSRVRTHGFTITSMNFQDAGNLDVERLRTCSLHVYKNGRHIPFCAYYL